MIFSLVQFLSNISVRSKLILYGFSFIAGAISKVPKIRKDSKFAPTVSSQVVVQSEKEKRLLRELRKEEKRHMRHFKSDIEADNELVNPEHLPLPSLERFSAL